MNSMLKRIVAVTAMACALSAAAGMAQMTVGTNVWHPAWGGTDSDPFTNGYLNVSGSNPWRAAFIEEVSHYTAIRFMDLGGLNSGEAPASWAARTPQSASDQMPMAYEWMIDMCNRAATDMWICIPYLWDVDLPGCRSLAQLIHSTLDAELRVYVEYGNENWSTGYNQDYCRSQGVAIGLGPSNQTTGDRYSAYASMKIWEEFEAVFGVQSPRLVRVLSGWDASASTCSAQLGFLVVDTVRNPNGTMPDLYCTAPYISPCPLSTIEAEITAMAGGLRSHLNVLSRAPVDIPLGYYEGGFGDCSHEVIATDPAAYDAMRMYLDTLDYYGGGVFNHLNHSSRRWGAKLYIGQPNDQAPIYRALIDWNAEHPVAVQHTPRLTVAGAAPAHRDAPAHLFTIDGRLLSGPQRSGGHLPFAVGLRLSPACAELVVR
jgi:hypothetical protein